MRELDGRPVAPGDLAALALANYGHFTTMLVSDGRVRGLDLHLARLAADCTALFGASLDPAEVRGRLRALDLPPRALVRVTVYAPDFDITHPARLVRPRLLLTTRPAPDGDPPPLRLWSARYQREVPTVKHTGLFGAMLHRRAAQRAGADDALFTDQAGRISEGPTWNAGFVDAHGRVVWPAGECLPGVTMRLLGEACQASGVPAVRRDVGLAAATAMRAAFATNAATGVRPVVALDTVRFASSDPVLDRLAGLYAAIPAAPL